MAKEERVASLSPKDYSEATGLFQGRGTVVEASFAIFDYDGKADPAPTAELVIQPEEGGEPVKQNWSVGKATDWMPSEDGKRLIAIGKANSINTSSNLALFITSLVNAGYPEDIGDDLGVLVGLEAEFTRVAAPKRPGLPTKEGEREKQVLIITEIYALPGEKKAAKGKAAAKPAAGKAGTKPTTTAATEETDSAEDQAMALVLEILTEKGEAVKKQQLSTLLFQKLKGNPEMKAIMQVAYSDDFLNSGPWSYEGGELSM